MQGTVVQQLAAVGAATDKNALFNILAPIADRVSSKPLTSPGFVIKSAASPLVKTGATVTYAIAKGVFRSIPASTDMAALVGTVLNATFNVYAFFLDSAGNLTSAMGAAATTLPGVKFPPIPVGTAVLGFIIVNPTGTGNFVGGTTALDDATVVPNVAYISLTSEFDPTVLVS